MIPFNKNIEHCILSSSWRELHEVYGSLQAIPMCGTQKHRRIPGRLKNLSHEMNNHTILTLSSVNFK